jgi:hypothetical protein
MPNCPSLDQTGAAPVAIQKACRRIQLVVIKVAYEPLKGSPMDLESLYHFRLRQLTVVALIGRVEGVEVIADFCDVQPTR